MEVVQSLFVTYGLNAIYALALLAAGWWFANFTERTFAGILSRTGRIDQTVATFLSSLARYAVLVFVALAVLQLFGIQTTSLIAVLGAASLAVGLALQGTLSNLAAGVMLLLFRPFRLGDRIQVGGQSGVVKALTLFFTELTSADNQQVILPNGQVWGAVLINHSTYDSQPLQIAVTVKNSDDLDAAIESLRKLAAGQAGVLADPAPSVDITKLSDDGTELTLKAWAKASEAGAAKAGLLRGLRASFYGANPAPAAKPAKARA